VPRQTKPSRDTARSHTPDAPRAIDRAAASSDVLALPRNPWPFLNPRLASAHSMRRLGKYLRSTLTGRSRGGATPGRAAGAPEHRGPSRQRTRVLVAVGVTGGEPAHVFGNSPSATTGRSHRRFSTSPPERRSNRATTLRHNPYRA
jgi:hypothetical protein